MKKNIMKVRLMSIVLIIVAVSLFVLAPTKQPLETWAETKNYQPSTFVGYSEYMDNDVLHSLTRLPSYQEDGPAITILVPGQGGEAFHFSNDGNENFVFEEDSILDFLIKGANNNVNLYWAKYPSKTSSDFFLYDLNEKTIYEQIDGGTDLNTIDKIQDISRHAIIFFESANNVGSHVAVYENLHMLIDKISYDYLILTGKIPKVNLISHSRGGLVSMMYATGYREGSKTENVRYDGDLNEIEKEYQSNGDIFHDHPYNVAGLYSMGTPYWGTEWGTKLTDVANNILPEAFNSVSAKNILDPVIQNELHNCWEVAVTKNPNLQLHAIVGETGKAFIPGLLVEEIAEFITINNLQESKLNAIIPYLNKAAIFANLINDLITNIEKGLITGAVMISITWPVFGWVISFVVTAPLIALYEVIRTQVNDVYYSVGLIKSVLQGEHPSLQKEDAASFLANLAYKLIELINQVDNFLAQVDMDCEDNIFDTFGDMFIDIYSQSAKDYSNVVTYTKVFEYSSLQFVEEGEGYRAINLESKNFSYNKSTPAPGIPHNLETHDADIINYIVDSITLSAPQHIYNYTDNQDGTITINSINKPDYYGSGAWQTLELSLNQGVDGKSVSKLGDLAFSLCNFLKTIELPSSLKTIGDRVFVGCSNLQTFSFNNVESIGVYAFVDCSSLTNIQISSTLTYIGDHAFKDCIGLSRISIPKETTYIGEGAFTGCDNLVIVISSENPNYLEENNVVYNKDKTKIVATGKIESSFIVPESVIEIGPYAFAENTNLVEIHFENTCHIKNAAFYLCGNLDYVYFYSYTEPTVDSTAFASSTFELYVPYSKQEQYLTAFQGFNCGTSALVISITFMTGNVEYKVINTYYGAEKTGFVTIIKPGHTFNGWFDEEGNRYANGGYWNCRENLTLYASWTPNDYPITFDKQGGVGGSDSAEAIYGKAMPLATAPTRIGYTFMGYYDSPNGVGTRYYKADMSSSRNWNKTSNTVLYAYWVANTYEVIFDKQGGGNGTDVVDVTFDSAMPQGLEAPTRLGWTFVGYYDQPNALGEIYYNADMVSVRNWDKTSGATLYAYWTESVYTITLDFNNDTNETWTITVGYGEQIVIASAPIRTHYKFLGYYSSKTGDDAICYVQGVLSNSDPDGYYRIKPVSTSATWQNDTDGTLYARWEHLEATIECTIVKIGEDILDTPYLIENVVSGQPTTITAPEIEGYEFDSWTINDVYYTGENNENMEITFTLHISYITGEVEIYNPNHTNSATFSDGYITVAVRAISE